MAFENNIDTLVLLPGLLCNQAVFQPLMAYLDTQTKDSHNRLNIIVPEYGVLECIEDIADNILASIKSDSFAVAGFSMGGFVGLDIASKAGDRCKKIAMIDSNFLAEPSDKQQSRLDQLARIKKHGLLAVFEAEIISLYFYQNRINQPNNTHQINTVEGASQKIKDNNRLKSLVLDMARSFSLEEFIAHSMALKNRKDYSDALQDFKGELLILAGKDDKLCPPSRQKEMYACANQGKASKVMFVPIEKAGHFALLEQPDHCHQAIEQWLFK